MIDTPPKGKFIGPCHRCQTQMWLPEALYVAAKHSSKIVFHCAYGHEAVFSEGESNETKLRRERDQLKQQLAYKDDMLRIAEQEIAVQSKLVKNLKEQRVVAVKRTKAGLCPCCSRNFRQLRLHIANKHPGFRAEEVA